MGQGVPLPGGPNVTLAAALPPNGLQAAMTVSGAVKGEVFATYLEQVLGPTLVPGDVVVLDNLPAHKVAGLAEIVAARGARLLNLPPYSPGFNPSELTFGKLKTWLRTAQARTREALEATSQAATEWISQQDAKTGLTIAVIMPGSLGNPSRSTTSTSRRPISSNTLSGMKAGRKKPTFCSPRPRCRPRRH